jgi:CRP/FNR family transcriptional regulator
VLTLTHQQIAAELGSSREVISRILADFAAGGLVQVARGSVTILDRPGLVRRAELLAR